MLALTALSSCSPISVQMDYLSRRNLASYRVGTPDPFINHPNIGERLIIQWSLPKNYLQLDDLHMFLTVRFRNNEEKTIVHPIRKTTGTYLYNLINECYYESGGILTYKIDIYGSGKLLECWRHQLWAELITFDQPCDKEN